jgi:hypothetical protein
MTLMERWRASRQTGWGKAGTVLLFPAIFFLLLEWQERDYAADGETVQGIALKKELNNRVSYSFSMHGGEQLEGSATVLPDTWAQLQPGTPVTVEYKRDSPRTNRVAGQTKGVGFWWKAAALLGAAGVILITIGAGKAASRRNGGTA